MTESGARAALIAEALSWVGTPFSRGMGAVKGRNGAVNCGLLLARCGIDAGIVPPFELPKIHPRFFVRPQEKLIEFIYAQFPGTHEVPEAKPGDLHLYHFEAAFGHCAIRVSETEIVHAYEAAGMVIVSRIDEPLLTTIPLGSYGVPRPVKYLDVISGLKG